jgi:hypothetical protein
VLLRIRHRWADIDLIRDTVVIVIWIAGVTDAIVICIHLIRIGDCWTVIACIPYAIPIRVSLIRIIGVRAIVTHISYAVLIIIVFNVVKIILILLEQNRPSTSTSAAARYRRTPTPAAWALVRQAVSVAIVVEDSKGGTCKEQYKKAAKGWNS